MSRTYYKQGQWNALCDRCGFKMKSGQLQLEWNGLRTCKGCFETRHPQDYVRAVPDNQGVPWTRSEGADVNVFTGVYFVEDYFSGDTYFATS